MRCLPNGQNAPDAPAEYGPIADSEEVNYEWWDIESVNGETMKWSAIREKEDGSRFNTTFTWKKIK